MLPYDVIITIADAPQIQQKCPEDGERSATAVTEIDGKGTVSADVAKIASD